MNNNLSQLSNDFVDARIRKGFRIVFAVVTLIVWIMMLLPKPVEPIDLGTGEHDQAGTTRLIEQAPVQPAPPQPKAQQQQTRQPAPRESAQVETAVAESPEDIDFVRPDTVQKPAEPTLPSPAPPVVAQQTPAAQPPAKPKFEIVAGTTAPRYVLASDELFATLAANQDCRFLVTDGRLTVKVGRVLTPQANMRAIGSEWHQLYAKRMVSVPNSELVRKVINAARTRYPLAQNTRCFLSVPHELDRAIFDAQRRYFGEQWDVSLTTTVDFSFGKPLVTGIVESGVNTK